MAQALGHGSDAITKKHYIKAEAFETGRARRIAGAFEAQRDTDFESITDALGKLSAEQLQKLAASVAERRNLI